MEPHIDVHPEDFPAVFPILGKVTGVFPKDHNDNPTGTITLYQVTLYLQSPATSFVLPFVPAKGMLAGGGNETEDPLLVGQWVIVNFLEGDPNRPFIDGLWFSPEQDTSIADTASTYPYPQWTRNGVSVGIDKDGTLSVAVPDTEKLLLLVGGTTLLELKKFGANYQANLGGTASLRKLLHEDAVTLYNSHTHPDPVSGTTGVPNQLMGSSHLTQRAQGF